MEEAIFYNVNSSTSSVILSHSVNRSCMFRHTCNRLPPLFFSWGFSAVVPCGSPALESSADPSAILSKKKGKKKKKKKKILGDQKKK